MLDKDKLTITDNYIHSFGFKKSWTRYKDFEHIIYSYIKTSDDDNVIELLKELDIKIIFEKTDDDGETIIDISTDDVYNHYIISKRDYTINKILS